MEKKYSIGVDIGGSHISSAAVDLQRREIVRETLVELPVDNKAEAALIISQWSKAIGESLSRVPAGTVRGVGFAMPGPFDYVNGICLIKGVPKYEKLYGTDIGKSVAAELNLNGEMDFRFMNDASSFAVGEAWAGKSAGSSGSMAITLGTGFGSAFVKGAVPVVTGDTVPDLGCVYHIKYEDGIADDYFSTRWFTSKYKELTGKDATGVKEIAEAAKLNEDVRNIFNHFGSSLGGFLAPFLIKFGAEVLVIGGNISRAFDLFGPDLIKALADQGCNTKVSVSVLKEDAALLGSAYLLDDNFWNEVKDILQYM